MKELKQRVTHNMLTTHGTVNNQSESKQMNNAQFNGVCQYDTYLLTFIDHFHGTWWCWLMILRYIIVLSYKWTLYRRQRMVYPSSSKTKKEKETPKRSGVVILYNPSYCHYNHNTGCTEICTEIPNVYLQPSFIALNVRFNLSLTNFNEKKWKQDHRRGDFFISEN